MNQKTTPILVVLLIIAAFLIGMFWTKIQYLEKTKGEIVKKEAVQTPSAQPRQPEITLEQIRQAFNRSLVKFGENNQKLVFLEISDPSCPFCQAASGQNSELNKQMGERFTLVKDGGTYLAPVPEIRKLVEAGKASFAFIYFPGHGNGEMATKALYCAFEKGKFWEVHDKLMTNEGYNLINNTVRNDKTKSQELADFLKPVFDQVAMKTCLESGKYDSQIKEEISLASSLGVSGTPGFFINTTNFAGAYSFKDMESVVDSALK